MFLKKFVVFQAEGFIDETSIDALAVCIGNVHGKYPPSGPNLKLDLLKVRQIQLHLHVECLMKRSLEINLDCLIACFNLSSPYRTRMFFN